MVLTKNVCRRYEYFFAAPELNTPCWHIILILQCLLLMNSWRIASIFCTLHSKVLMKNYTSEPVEPPTILFAMQDKIGVEWLVSLYSATCVLLA